MSNYKAREYFYDWYKTLPINIDEETGNKRIEAIDIILENDDEGFWFDLLNLYFKVKPVSKENKGIFVNEFHEKDATFPLSKNDNIIQTLAGICLCILFDEQTSQLNDKLSYAILNSNFYNQLKLNTKIPVTEYAVEYLKRDGDRVKKEADSSDVEDLEILEELDIELTTTNRALAPAETLSIIKSINTLHTSNLLLREELDVLWWLMGEFSINGSEYFNKLGLQSMIFLGAKDLSELTLISQSLKSSISFLKKTLYLSNNGKNIDSKTSIVEAAKSLTESQFDLITNVDNISIYTPCLNILNKLKIQKITDDSISTICGNVGFDISKTISPIELSKQLYEEYIYLKQF